MSGRALGWVVGVVLAALIVGLVVSEVDNVVRRLGLPLSDASVIREQAGEKHLDPALIAAVIYAETKFDPRPSPAGAEGLMQILPGTAYFIAHLSGGTSFTSSDLATPRINVAYGSYYLRYLLNHTTATRCSPSPRTTEASRTSTAGWRRPMPPAGR